MAARRGGSLQAKGPAPLPQTGTRTRTEEAMEERLGTLEPGSLRYRVLHTAIDFKRSWLELAQHLNEVARGSQFKEWGYRTFEAYAQHELHLRRETAQKLVRSYDFLATHEPGALDDARAGEAPVPLPNYQALDVLAEARKNPYLSERDYRELRDQVFREDPAPGQVRKAVRDRAPEAADKSSGDPAERLRKCLALSERLYGMLLEEEDLPERIPQSLEQVVAGLRQILEG